MYTPANGHLYNSNSFMYIYIVTSNLNFILSLGNYVPEFTSTVVLASFKIAFSYKLKDITFWLCERTTYSGW